MPQSPAWFRRHFNEDYLLLYSGRSHEQARREAGFVAKQLGLGPDDRVLDLCCGFGRHLEALREHRVVAVGVDLSKSLLGVARERLSQRDAPSPDLPRNELVCADMRSLPFPDGTKDRDRSEGFDAIVSFFTSFGYFEDPAEHTRVAREMSRVLRPGGVFALDLMNAQRTIRELVPHSSRESGPYEIEEERQYDATRRRIEKSIQLKHRETGESKRYFESVRVFEEEEIRALLSAAGLEIESVFGDFDTCPFEAESPRMLLVGRKGDSV
ncbi:MAG: class I SAM-dependent methyltransferase [Planctomycetota bacterium]